MRVLRFTFLAILISGFFPFLSIADQTHFEAEKVKPSVEWYREYRTTAEIEADNWCFCELNAGDPGMAYYDATIDGVVLPIKRENAVNVPFSALTPFRNSQGSITTANAVWVQFEIYMDQDFYNATVGASGTLGFDTMKVWRYHMAKGQCGTEDRFYTHTWLGTDDDAVEVAVSSGCYDWPDQGVDTNYTVPADQWVRITTVFDISGQEMRFYATNISTGVTELFYSYPTTFPSPFTMQEMRLQVHSTTRNHNPTWGDDNYDFIIGYRNVIVSTDTIAFTTGGGGDVTEPAVSITQSDPQTITSDSLTITGTATDAVGVTDVEWLVGSAPSGGDGTNCTADDGAFDSTSEAYTCSTSGYSLGTNSIHIGAGDAANNWGSNSIVVNYQGTSSDAHYFDTGLTDNNVASATPDCATYDPTDGSCGDGSDKGFATVADANALAFAPGAVLYFNKGDDWTSETLALNITYSGTEANPIEVDAFGTGADPILYDLTITADRVNVSNLKIDHQTADSTCVEIDGAYITLDGLEITNGQRDGMDITGSNVTIQNTTIHHFYRGYYGRDPVLDAHLIALRDVHTVLIDNCTLYNFSGDAVQADPTYGDTNNITIQNSTLYSTALASDFSGSCPTGDGWCTGDKGGENFIDTKADTDVRTTWTITNNIFYGLDDIPVIPNNRAALNFKHNTNVIANRNKIYDNEIGVRIRGDDDMAIGNPWVLFKNNILYDNDRAIWVGDGDGSTGTTYDEPSKLRIQNNTIGDGNTTFYDEDDQTQFEDWDLRNNAFLGTKPTRFSDASNISAVTGDFTDTASDDYTLSSGSNLKGAGDMLGEVLVDYAGISRMVPYDSGAYEDPKNPPIQNGFVISNGVVQ